VPDNARLNGSSYGSGWDCKRGFREVDDACEPLQLPENAHIDYSGNDWDCNRPNRRQQDRCVPR